MLRVCKHMAGSPATRACTVRVQPHTRTVQACELQFAASIAVSTCFTHACLSSVIALTRRACLPHFLEVSGLPMVSDTRFAVPRPTTVERSRPWQKVRDSSLWRLLRYVPLHRRPAIATLCFGVLGFLLSFVYPSLIGSAVDLVAGAGKGALGAADRQRLLQLVACALLTAAVHSIVVYGRGHSNVQLSNAIVTDLRRDLFTHLQKLSVRFYTKGRIGSILARILNDVQDATALVYTGLIVAALDAVQLVLAVLLLSRMSLKLTLACLTVFPFYALIFVTRNRRVRDASERLQTKLCQISGNLAELLAGQALVKTCTAEHREAERFAHDVAHHHELVVAQSHEGHVVAALGEILVDLGTTTVIGYGGWLALHGELSAGTLTRYLGYVIIMYGPVRRFAELNMTYQTSLSAMQRVFRVFEIRPTIEAPAVPRAAAPSEGEVRFEDVWFRFEEESDEARVQLDDDARPSSVSCAPAWVLRGASLVAAAGERVAIVGLSGAGKTTLLSLLPRLYDVTQGRVTIDGVDVRDYTIQGLRSAIAIVQQESFLFSGSILDNIAYGRPEATPDEVIEAAKAAHAHEFIMAFPKGYRTHLGERGVNLSGGQRQRLSIARAILKNPRILILDEATSSLDAESEYVVQQALERLMRGRTSFIIAHRLSTIESADRIVVLEAGVVAEVGTHAELLERGGIYHRLVARQRAELDIETMCHG
jgi:ABC-type multidrug transport system fused ATPase/permease subunit